MIQRLLFCLVLLAAGSVAGGAELRLRSSVLCSTAVVRLGDLAEIAADEPPAAEQLAKVALFPAPRAGGSRQLDRNQVQQLLAISGIDLEGVQITGSDFVVVQSSNSKPAAESVKRGGAKSAVRPASHEALAPPTTSPKVAAPAPEPLPLVERGDSVTIHSKAAGVRVTISGKALRQGALGDEVEIELADKKQKVLGRITGPRQIEIVAQP